MTDTPEKVGPTVRGDALAEMFECSQRQVQRFARDGVIPRASRGMYPLAASVRGYVRLLKAGGGGATNEGPIDPTKLDPFRQRAFWQAHRERAGAEALAGELVERADFEETLASSIKALLRIRALRDYLERDGVPLEVVAMVEKHVEAICTEIYEQLGKHPSVAQAVEAEADEVPA